MEEGCRKLKLLEGFGERILLCREPKSIIVDSFNADYEAKYSTNNRATLIKKCIDGMDNQYKAFGAFSYNEYRVFVGNSMGIERYARGNYVEVSILIINGNAATNSGYYKDITSYQEDISFERVFDKAYQKASFNINQEEIEPGKYTVILEPKAVGDLLTFMSFTGFSGDNYASGKSFMVNNINKQIFSKEITIKDDYTNPNTVYIPFDDEGTPKRALTLIENGIAKNITHDLSSGTKFSCRSTGHSNTITHYGNVPRNLVIDGGETALDEIIKNTDRGILVTRFHYINALDPREALLTGLTKDGLFLIEKGQITKSLKNMRFSESMLHAFNNILAVSKDRERTTLFYFGNNYVPAIKIREFNFSSKA